MSARPMIEVDDVRKRFGAVEAVRGVTFSVAEGEIVGFLGPNGAGKTTTMRMLAGIFPPTSGAVRIAGEDVASAPATSRRTVGYFPENAPYYPDLTVDEYLRFVARMKRIARAGQSDAVGRVLAECGLDGMARRRVGTLSKGYRQRVGLAQALLGDPPLLILDEPTAGLDPSQVVEIRELIASLRGTRTVLFSSHILSEVETLCERVVVIAKGRVVGQGSTRDLAQELGARQRVTVRVEGPTERVESCLRALGHVHRVVADGERFVVEADGAVPLARRVGEAVAREGWIVLELVHERVELEDVFLELVRGAGR